MTQEGQEEPEEVCEYFYRKFYIFDIHRIFIGRVVEDMQVLPDVLPTGSGRFGGVKPSLKQQAELCLLMGLPGNQHHGASSPHLPSPASNTKQPGQAAFSCLPLHGRFAQKHI